MSENSFLSRKLSNSFLRLLLLGIGQCLISARKSTGMFRKNMVLWQEKVLYYI